MEKKTMSPSQKSILLGFLEEHPEVVKNKQSNQFTNAGNISVWQELATRLNSMPGATKTWKEWRKTWSDIKTRTKKKLADNKKQAMQTGGGPNTSSVVDEVDDKVLDIIGGDVVIEGLDIPEIGIDAIEVTDSDHQYALHPIGLGDVKEVELHATDVSHTTPKQKKQKRVRPPLSSGRKRASNPTQAAMDLVAVTERRNEIKENYYSEKLKIMKENLKCKKDYLELKKQEIDLKKEQMIIEKNISTSVEALLKKK